MTRWEWLLVGVGVLVLLVLLAPLPGAIMLYRRDKAEGTTRRLDALQKQADDGR